MWRCTAPRSRRFTATATATAPQPNHACTIRPCSPRPCRPWASRSPAQRSSRPFSSIFPPRRPSRCVPYGRTPPKRMRSVWRGSLSNRPGRWRLFTRPTLRPLRGYWRPDFGRVRQCRMTHCERERTAGEAVSASHGGAVMNFVAIKMLTGDRAKYLGLIFAIAFSTFLLAQQSSLFVVVINRTRSFIVDVTDADIWVMAPATRYLDEVFSLKDNDVDRVRSVPGVRWAVPFYKGSARVIAADGQFRQTTLLGVDDASLAGAPEPRRMVLGSIENLRDPDAVVIDLQGYHSLFPGEPLTLGKTLEMNDHRANIVGIVSASVPFGPLPVFYTR